MNFKLKAYWVETLIALSFLDVCKAITSIHICLTTLLIAVCISEFLKIEWFYKE